MTSNDRVNLQNIDNEDRPYDIEIEVQNLAKDVIPAVLTIDEKYEGVVLTLRFEDNRIETEREQTTWDALLSLRRTLETQDFLILCAGAQLDMGPLPMSYDMSGGWVLSRFVIGAREDRALRRGIFDPIEGGIPATIEEQEAHYQAWLASIKYPPSFAAKILDPPIGLLIDVVEWLIGIVGKLRKK